MHDQMRLTHEAVQTQRMTSCAAPVQIEGTLTDGTVFYFRYRFGEAEVGIGKSLGEAVGDAFHHAAFRTGRKMDSCFGTEVELNAAFAAALREARQAQ